MAGGMRAALEKEFARLRKASGSVETHLKSAADEIALAALALEEVLSKELPPGAAATMKVIERELAAYKKSVEQELTRLSKSYDREFAKLKRAKARVDQKAAKAKARPAAKKTAAKKPAAKKTAAKKPAARRRARPAAMKA